MIYVPKDISTEVDFKDSYKLKRYSLLVEKWGSNIWTTTEVQTFFSSLSPFIFLAIWSCSIRAATDCPPLVSILNKHTTRSDFIFLSLTQPHVTIKTIWQGLTWNLHASFLYLGRNEFCSCWGWYEGRSVYQGLDIADMNEYMLCKGRWVPQVKESCLCSPLKSQLSLFPSYCTMLLQTEYNGCNSNSKPSYRALHPHRQNASLLFHFGLA